MIVVEGPWDVLRITQAGFPAVVALLGHDFSRGQVALLTKAPKVVVMLDGDEAGREGARKLVAALGEHPVEVVELPDGADPADLSDEELRALLACFLPSPVPPCPRDR